MLLLPSIADIFSVLFVGMPWVITIGIGCRKLDHLSLGVIHAKQWS